MELVTGATGLVGANLLYKLAVNSDSKVCGLYRDERNRQKVKRHFLLSEQENSKSFDRIIWRKADLLDVEDLKESLKGISKIYHCASLVSFSKRDNKKLFHNNVLGTTNLVNVAIENQVEKILFVSSVAGLGSKNDKTVINESQILNQPNFHSYYGISKHLAEIEIWRALQEGIDVQIVYPGVVLSGPFLNRSSDRLIPQIKKFNRFYTKGDISLIGMDDLCGAIIRLMHSNHEHKRWILVSQTMSIKDFIIKVNTLFGQNPPNYKIGLVAWIVLKFIDSIAQVFGISFFQGASYESTTSTVTYDSSLITEKLDFKYRSIDQVLVQLKNQFL